jgi:DNA polymerase III alpha subunit
MYIKLYYPEEFICASLTYGSESNKENIIQEAVKKELDIRPPKVGKSDSHKWIVKKGIMYCPFIEIKGFGDSKAKEISGKKKTTNIGFFDVEDTSNIKSSKNKTENILNDIGAYEDEEITDRQASKIKDYFGFSFKVENAYKRY